VAVGSTRRLLSVLLFGSLTLAGSALLSAPAQAIGAPSGLAPSGPVSSSTPTLSWHKVVGAAKYDVQVDDSPGFDSPVFSVSTTNNRAVPDVHLPAGSAAWRVRSVTSSGATSGWSTASLSVGSTAAPTPVSPVGGVDLAQPDEPPLLTWSAVAGAEGYDVEVTSEGDTDWVSPTSYSAPGTSLMMTTPQPAGGWKWRVRADRGNGLVTLWSDEAAYSVNPLGDVIADPDMQNGGTIQDVVLDWQPVSGAAKYEIQVGLDNDFTIPIETRIVYGTRYSPVVTYDNDQYYWRVRAIDSAGTKMPWPTTAFQFQRDWPDRPTLLRPADQFAPATGDPLYFQWTPVPHATRYQLDVGDDPNFSPGTFDTCFTAATTYAPGNAGTTGQTVDPCLPGQGIPTYWRVRALDAPRNPVVEGIYSEIHKFVYDSGKVTQLAPGDGATVGVPTLMWAASREAAKYFVEIRDASDKVAASATTYALSWTPEGTTKLDPAKSPFTWTVQAVDSNGSMSPKYAGRSFTLSGVMPTTGAPPLTPLTGVAGDPATTRFPALSWEPVASAAYYRIQIGVAGSGFWLPTDTAHVLTAKYPYPAATDTDDYFLNPGSYDWRVQALDSGGGSLGYGPMATFTISDLPSVTGQAIALDGLALDAHTSCAVALGNDPTNEQVCTGVPATPVLDWQPVPGAAFYMVYLANDRELTNRIFTGAATTNTRWTPTSSMVREALADNQAGQSYYWFVRPCKAPSHCAPDPISVHASATNAFRKVSPAVVLQQPGNGTSRADDITFTWQDYYDTNASVPYAGGAAKSPQTAQKYRIEISATNTFGTLLDYREVDQPTYTPFDGTLPEGNLFWRVQAIDAEGNHLQWSPVWHVTKDSQAVTLTSPVGGAQVGGATPFRWTPHGSAASYTVEVYKFDDATFSSANRVFTATTKQAAYAWSKYLPTSGSAYRWRVRWIDADNHPGPWSAAGRFFVQPGLVSLTAPANGVYQPAAAPYLAWQPVATAAEYLVEVRRSGATSSSVRATTVAQAYALTRTLADGVYEWRVTAYDPSGGVLGTSGWRWFKIDATAPTVISKSPTSTALRTANFVAKFSEKVVGVGTNTMRLYVAGRTTPLAATVTLSADRLTATLNPSANLVAGKFYTLKLSSGIRDLAGNALAATSWRVQAK